MYKHDDIFKYDTKGNLRVWFMERDGSRYRTTAGIQGGVLTTSEWTQAAPTNIGRSNERSAEDQAVFEIEASYRHKLTREYHETPELAKSGAHFYKPMLAHKYESFAPGLAQPKLDGVRCIAMVDGLFSRQGKPITSCSHIEEALRPLFEQDPDLVLDGELYNHDLKDNFNELISLIRKQKPTSDQLAEIAASVQYHIYDMPSHTGLFSERISSVAKMIMRHAPNPWFDDQDGMKVLRSKSLQVVHTMRVEDQETFDQAHGRWLEAGFEGSMWRANSVYEPKRSKALLKRKEFIDQEFEVVRIEEGLGNWSGMAKRVVCRLPDGREFGAGIKGSMERARELLHEDHKVVTVKYFQLTPDGVPRFPVATHFWGKERTL